MPPNLENRQLFTRIVSMKVEVENLKTVRNYAKKIKRNRSRIYQMIEEDKLSTIKIDGVTFIDIQKTI